MRLTDENFLAFIWNEVDCAGSGGTLFITKQAGPIRELDCPSCHQAFR